MKTTSIFLVISLVLWSMFQPACKKEDVTNPLAEIIEADDEVASYFDEILSEVDELTYVNDNSIKDSEVISENSGSRTVETTFSGDTIIHTITFVDFINGNSQYQRVKNGVIVIKKVGLYYQPTFWRKVMLIDFYINDNQIEGTNIIIKTGDFQHNSTLTNGRITFPDGTTYTREFNRVRTWTSGYGTPHQVWDDEFAVEGEAWGVNRQNDAYTHTIINSLIIHRNCRWIVAGVINFVVGNKTGTLNYGDGECDREATLTVDGESWTIILKKRN